jgi:MEMO1 family protein
MLPEIDPRRKARALAVIAPHAGYIYSGGIAAETFARVEIPADVILLGPNHRGLGSEVAIMRKGFWRMPFGDVPVNEQLALGIIEQAPEMIVADEYAHRHEHSLEVQIPFLQYLQNDLRLTPLVLSRLSYQQCLKLGNAIADAVNAYGGPVLVVASTDMTHYEPRTAATKKDRLAIGEIEGLDAEGLYRTVTRNMISMCGAIPTVVTMIAAVGLGAERAELIRYSDSGETSGDLDQVVGYAGLVIY